MKLGLGVKRKEKFYTQFSMDFMDHSILVFKVLSALLRSSFDVCSLALHCNDYEMRLTNDFGKRH